MFPLLRRGPARLTARQVHRRTGYARAVPLDVREPPRRLTGHAPGAPHPPLSVPRAGAAPPRAAQGGPVVTVRRSGSRSRTATGFIAARGAAATDVVGGTTARTREGLPVTVASGGIA
ncbi:rhodanese-like domain-containing protein [Streptomyces malaysiensis]|uniref:rhodanese-like domain-containing protein n=1 Tax=Streptomyces malaysiensis TaxID=92644 RepID=UPI0011CDEB86|nr:rhodanese-like domain-containing protein [Streptomyces malaysiensis]